MCRAAEADHGPCTPWLHAVVPRSIQRREAAQLTYPSLGRLECAAVESPPCCSSQRGAAWLVSSAAPNGQRSLQERSPMSIRPQPPLVRRRRPAWMNRELLARPKGSRCNPTLAPPPHVRSRTPTTPAWPNPRHEQCAIVKTSPPS